jgi:hypothetical protein
MQTRRPPNVEGMPPLAPDHEFVGLAILTGKRCLIWIRSGMTRTETCATVAHEQGHWDGHDDNEPGLPVMRGDDWSPVPECEVPA